MGRLALGVTCLLGVGMLAGCGRSYDCEEACLLMRDCGFLVGTAYETCEVRCMQDEEPREVDIDVCGECLDEEECAATCREQCLCAVGVDLAEYPGVACTP